MFRAIMTSCSIAVRIMHACAQGGLGGRAPIGGESGEFGGGHAPWLCENEFYAPLAVIASLVTIERCPAVPIAQVYTHIKIVNVL